MLAAASVLAGETKPPDNVTGIDSLKSALEDAKAELVESPANKGFRGKVTRGEPSSDVKSAAISFKAVADQTVDSVVDDSGNAISKALEAIKDKQKNVLEAFDSIAQLFSAGAQLEGLVKAAWEKLQSGLRFLNEILSSIPIPDVRDQVKKVSDRVKETFTVRAALEFVYQTAETRELIREMQVRPDIDETGIDEHRDDLSQLGKDFSKFVKAAVTVSAIASFVVGIVGVHVTGPLALLTVPATHALVIGVVLVVGICINNAWVTVRQVHDIRDSIREVAVIVPQNA